MSDEVLEENLNLLCNEKRVKVLVRQILERIVVQKKNNLNSIKMLEELREALISIKNDDFLKEQNQEEINSHESSN